MQEVRQERTGWRDRDLSERHRHWGWNCPALDIDFLMVEYDSGEPAAIVEYKHEQAARQRSSHPSYRAMIQLGNRAGVPVVAVRYADDFSWWRVVPLNKRAREYIPETATMTEREWVAILYLMRGRTLTDEEWASILGSQEI